MEQHHSLEVQVVQLKVLFQQLNPNYRQPQLDSNQVLKQLIYNPNLNHNIQLLICKEDLKVDFNKLQQLPVNNNNNYNNSNNLEIQIATNLHLTLINVLDARQDIILTIKVDYVQLLLVNALHMIKSQELAKDVIQVLYL